MRFHICERAYSAIACVGSRQLGKELCHHIARRGQPRVLRVGGGPRIERIFIENEQVRRFLGQQRMRFVARTQLHYFVADAQRAYLKLSEVLIGGRIAGGALVKSEKQEREDLHSSLLPKR